MFILHHGRAFDAGFCVIGLSNCQQLLKGCSWMKTSNSRCGVELSVTPIQVCSCATLLAACSMACNLETFYSYPHNRKAKSRDPKRPTFVTSAITNSAVNLLLWLQRRATIPKSISKISKPLPQCLEYQIAAVYSCFTKYCT